jgi:deazaflavin-dependent oxidoreductase (nitroreductase family)
VPQGRTFPQKFEKHATNPLVRSALRLGIAPKAFALLETTGRHSGSLRLTPVGNGLSGSTFWLVSMHGLHCDYVKNLVANPRVRVKVRRKWYSGTARIEGGENGLARRRELDRSNGLVGRIDGVVFRAGATEPLMVRIDLGEGADSSVRGRVPPSQLPDA